MLPFPQKIAFLLFAAVTLTLGFWGFYCLYLRIRRGTTDPESRFNNIPRRIIYALTTTLTQQRTFKKRPTIGLFHSFIFYGFVFYGLVNLVDAAEGYLPSGQISFSSSVPSLTHAFIYTYVTVVATYSFLADLLSFLVLLGVIALVIRRFALPSRTDFRFNPRTLLHQDVKQQKITRDSLIVSAFILFHVGSRAIGAGAKIAAEGPDPLQPFATLLSHLFTPANAEAFRIFGYWGALGSVLAFLAYFPYTKHIHIFMAPAKYLVAREPSSGVLPPVALNLDTENETESDAEANAKTIVANKLEDLAWPRLLDAYACIQCNRCQDVCPATVTGKSLSPAALEINKRMELNDLAAERSPFVFTSAPFEKGAPSPRPLLQFALSPEAAWACTTCGACMEVCPTQNEQMLDIIDIRRNQVMIEGEFPSQLQSAFRGMERAQNPWGINHEQRLAWADGLNVKTTDENPTPDVLYWVGCAASYDPQAQKTARAFVELLTHAEVNFAVLGKKECCTGDSARRAGNEYLYRQLADKNVSTLNTIQPKLIVASCPHCMNSIGHEYKQIGGDYKVLHHTEYLETLVATKKLTATPSAATITYHDPCYLGRHNGVYEAPRNLLNILSNSTPELPRNHENSFCCGAGGAQFWKEEEEGNERISDNRFREAQQTLAPAAGEKVLAVGCPFCKSMLGSTPTKADSEDIAIKDVAELLLEGVRRSKGLTISTPQMEPVTSTVAQPVAQPVTATLSAAPPVQNIQPIEIPAPATPSAERKKWQPKSPSPIQSAEAAVSTPVPEQSPADAPPTLPTPERKKWQPKAATPVQPEPDNVQASTVEILPIEPPTPTAPTPTVNPPAEAPTPERKKWQPKSSTPTPASEPTAAAETATPPVSTDAPTRKKWTPKKPT
jgi:Fe-S oxidoreductase